MAHTKAKTLFTILFVVVLATSTTSSSSIKAAPSRFNKLTVWTDWINHMRDVIVSSISWDSYGVNQRNFTHPKDIQLDWKNMAKLGLPDGYEIDESCKTFENFFYRTLEGHCNWPMKGEIDYGKLNTCFFRDHNDTYFQDQVSKPRAGPNPRLLSNLLFKKNTDKQEYEHTPILVALVEFVIHDLVFSMPSNEIIEIPIPRCDEAFDPECHGNKTMKVRRSAPMEGTGTDPSNPRMTKNGVTSWLDMSALYGSTPEVANKLRAFKSGKMLTQTGPDGKEYPPYNTAGVPMFGHHRDPAKIFMFGDPRGNQDWLIIAIQTLLLREHNKLCDIFEAQFPYWDDQTIYEFARVAMSTKYQMIANNYQQAYFTEEMPHPWWDGVPLFRQWHGKNMLQMNAITSFPFWPGLVNKKPVTSSEEMTIGYRFHEILPVLVPLINATGHTVDQCHLVKTAFDSEGFMNANFEDFLRGMAMTQIPKFHTGTSDEYRNMKFNFGDPKDVRYYDLVAQTIIHERERGLPTFNQYYAKYTGKPAVKPRKTFAEFSSNPEYVKVLESLYNHPDEVDLTVGQYLDEELYPGTTVPRSQLITSLFSLFAVGVSDRFSAAYSSVKCIPFIGTQTFLTCTPSNALEYLLWTPKSFMGIKYHWFDSFWFKELNIHDSGYSALWRLITENSDVKCLQKDPLYPADPVKNPVVCSLEEFYPFSATWAYFFLTKAAPMFILITAVLAVRSVKPQVEQD